MPEEIKDITIIGAGPAGLFTAFQAGMHELSIRIIDSLPEPGGQLTALYPEKYIFDVPGFPRVSAKELAKNLFEQANQFNPDLRFDETAIEIVETGGAASEAGYPVLEIITDKGRYPSRTVIIAAGLGAFKPRTLSLSEMDQFAGNGIHYFVREKELFKGKDLVIVGGGDSALDWTLNLLDTAREITVVHRRETFRAHPNTLQKVAENAGRGRIRVYTNYEVKRVSGGGSLEEVAIVDGTGNEIVLKADALLLMLGFTSDLGFIGKWGLELDDSRIKVGVNMETSRRGIFAIGDIVNYPGKLKLILTGFSDGTQAVRNAIQHIRPGDKVRQSYSTTLKIFAKKQ